MNNYKILYDLKYKMIWVDSDNWLFQGLNYIFSYLGRDGSRIVNDKYKETILKNLDTFEYDVFYLKLFLKGDNVVISIYSYDEEIYDDYTYDSKLFFEVLNDYVVKLDEYEQKLDEINNIKSEVFENLDNGNTKLSK